MVIVAIPAAAIGTLRSVGIVADVDNNNASLLECGLHSYFIFSINCLARA